MEQSLAVKIEKDLMDQTIPTAAVELKKKWLKIADVLTFRGEPKLEIDRNASDEEIKRYTEEFINNGSANIKLANGKIKTISVSEIDGAIARQNSADAGADYPLLSDELPSRRTLAKVAEATARGAESQSGFGSMIMNFFVGLMNWIAGMFSGDENRPGFWESVANVGAPKIGGAVADELQQAAANDPGVSKFLRHRVDNGLSVGDNIISQAMGTARTKITGDDKHMPSSASAPDMKLAKKEESKLPSNDDVRKQVYSAITDGRVESVAYDEFKKMADAQLAATSGVSGWFARTTGFGAPSDQEIRSMAHKATNLIANTVSDAVADPQAKAANGKKLNELSKDEFAKEMADRILKQAEAKKAELGIPESMFVKDPKTGERPIDKLRPQVESAIAQRHHEIKPGLDVVAANEQNKIASAATKQPSSTVASNEPANGHVPTPGIPQPRGPNTAANAIA